MIATLKPLLTSVQIYLVQMSDILQDYKSSIKKKNKKKIKKKNKKINQVFIFTNDLIAKALKWSLIYFHHKI